MTFKILSEPGQTQPHVNHMSPSVQLRALLSPQCEPTVGTVGEETLIPCSFRLPPGEDLTLVIYSATKTKKEEKRNTLLIVRHMLVEDSRVKTVNNSDPSLIFTHTAVSDEGEYDYTVRTNHGFVGGTFSLRVRAAYGSPTMSSSPDEVEDGDRAELSCSTSGGYPAGGIHWFDSTGANWTERATLEITKRDDRLLTMSSKLTLTVDSRLRSFRCIILSSEFTEEAEETFHLKRRDPCPCCSSGESCTVRFCTRYNG
ncbi:cell adhesion molecule 2-like [Hoplias malabaricus]|uniref:cell adhesion molecule 2-like n=1 Tax=Hoplias malabaricus TaxID=27720 RepID=UPI003463398B